MCGSKSGDWFEEMCEISSNVISGAVACGNNRPKWNTIFMSLWKTVMDSRTELGGRRKRATLVEISWRVTSESIRQCVLLVMSGDGEEGNGVYVVESERCSVRIRLM